MRAVSIGNNEKSTLLLLNQPNTTITAIGISLITKVTDCRIPPTLEPMQLNANIDTALRKAMGIIQAGLK